jgi:hypothetical protein
MIRVRFHLAKGEHFRKWQVRHADGSVTYHDPETTTILMRDCYLRNSRKVAERIHGGENKTVCAWVLCRKVHIWTSTPQPTPEETQIAMVRFNPRVLPYWHDEHGTDLDGARLDRVMSWNRDLFGAMSTSLSMIG